MVEAGGIEPPQRGLQNPDRNHTQPAQVLTVSKVDSGHQEQKTTLPEHSPDTVLHKKCALCVHLGKDLELQTIVKAWPELPSEVRTALQKMARTYLRGTG